MSGQGKIDDLIDELYPTAAAAKGITPPISESTPAHAQGGHSFDDEDDSVSPVGTSQVTHTVNTAVSKPAVPWPSLPPNLAPSVHCGVGTFTLTSYASPTAIREQQRLMHLDPSQLRSAVACRPSHHGADDDGGRWCPYMRCRHCDHPVVRLQGAYWTAPVAPTSASSDNVADAPQSTRQRKQHAFDDSDDDITPPSSSASPASGADGASSRSPAAVVGSNDMYMQMRYHYPDFSAFPVTALRRLTDTAGESAVAAYCCQCTWVSVLEPKLTMPCAGHGVPPAAVPTQPSSAGVYPPPSSSSGVQWACKGHIACA